MNIKTHLNLLGMKVEDRVTGFKGVLVSVSFDLYGCIQAVVNPGLDKDGKLDDAKWFDVNRLIVTSAEPVMNRPNFDFGQVAEGNHGPAEKPDWGQA